MDNEIKKVEQPDIERGMTISQFMAKKGLQDDAGVELKSDTDKGKSSSSSSLKGAIVSEDGRKYEMGGMVGKGGMGMVLSAKDVNIRRKIAMKVALGEGDEIDDEQLMRFISEAQVTGQLEHPSIMPVYELGVDASENVFYTMKLIKGDNLRDILKRIKAGDEATIRAYPLNHLLNIFLKACDAMAYAHSKGVIHRDLKPENIMIGEYGEVVVLDWGLAKVISADDESTAMTEAGKALADRERVKAEIESIRHDEGSGTYQTMAGIAMGTPEFMAPEQALGKLDAVSSRTDIYALGGFLYQILSLRVSVTAKNTNMMLIKVTQGDLDPLENNPDDEHLPHLPAGKIPHGLAAVAMKALALDPKDRYSSVKAMQLEIEKWQAGFATEAEGASALTRLTLFVKRNKVMATAVLLTVVSLVTGLAVSLYGLTEAKKSEKTAKENADIAAKNERIAISRFNELKATAPVFYRQAKEHIRRHQFEDALKMIDYAIKLSKDSPEYHFLRGKILQLLFRFDESAESLRKSLALKSDDRVKRNLKLSLKFRATQGQLKVPALEELRTEMSYQGRYDEAIALARRMEEDNTEVLKLIRARLKQSPIPALKGYQVGINNGLLTFQYRGGKSRNLKGIEGLPFNQMLLYYSHIEDLSALSGMPLTHIALQETRSLRDISPLKGLPLVFLNLVNTKVQDVSALKGMPLTHLNLGGTKVEDISALKGMSLKHLDLTGTKVEDISALKGMPLTYLRLPPCVKSLVPLAGCPLNDFIFNRFANLKNLDGLQGKGLKLNIYVCPSLESLEGVQGNQVLDVNGKPGLFLTGTNALADIRALKGMKLTRFVLPNSPIENISALRGASLNEFNINGCRNIEDLSPLEGMKLRKLGLANTKVKDLSVLKGMPLMAVNLSGSSVRSLKPLSDCPLKVVDVYGCKWLKSLDGLQDKGLKLCIQGCPALESLEGVQGNQIVDTNGNPILNAGSYLSLKDISALKGMRLTSVDINRTKVSDISSLQGMELKVLDISYTDVKSIEALKGMPLEKLSLSRHVSDLSPLSGTPLKELHMDNYSAVRDFSPLRTTKLRTLTFGYSNMTDISSLKGLSLQHLNICRVCDLKDLSVLKGMPLVELTLPVNLKNLDISFLRDMKTLKKLNGKLVKDFWREYDAKKKAKQNKK